MTVEASCITRFYLGKRGFPGGGEMAGKTVFRLYQKMAIPFEPSYGMAHGAVKSLAVRKRLIEMRRVPEHLQGGSLPFYCILAPVFIPVAALLEAGAFMNERGEIQAFAVLERCNRIPDD